ncbi:MAG: DUF2125 domain-containing protein [Pseudomonadota bacterium]
MQRFRVLVTVTVLFALGWSGWWLFAATAKERALTGWLTNRAAAGWIAETRSLRVTGFPARLDTLIEGLALGDPARGWGWESAEFQILALAYQPNHIIAAWPGRHRVTWSETLAARLPPLLRTALPPDRLGTAAWLSAESWRGSVVFVPGLDLTLDRLQTEIAQMQIEGEAGWTLQLDAARLAARRAPDADPAAHRYDLFAELSNARLAPAPGDDTAAPPALETLRISAQASFDAPFDRHMVRRRPSALRAMTLDGATLSFGEVDIAATGALTIDANGVPEGRFDLQIRNWRKALDLAVAQGALDPALREQLESGLAVLAVVSGGDGLRVPLLLSGGRVALGPIPIGQAPRFTPPLPAVLPIADQP